MGVMPVWVQVPPRAPYKKGSRKGCLFYFYIYDIYLFISYGAGRMLRLSRGLKELLLSVLARDGRHGRTAWNSPQNHRRRLAYPEIPVLRTAYDVRRTALCSDYESPVLRTAYGVRRAALCSDHDPRITSHTVLVGSGQWAVGSV